MGQRQFREIASPHAVALCLGVAVGALAAHAAHAALGGDLASVDRDHAALQAERVVTAAVGYDLHELTTPAGTRVREYLDRSGRVFAVSWEGPRPPDLRQLLGAYAERYAAAVRSHQATRRSVLVSAADLQLTATRLPRGFSGQALLPAAVPDGVRREDLR